MNKNEFLEYLEKEFANIKKNEKIEDVYIFRSFGEDVGEFCKKFDCEYSKAEYASGDEVDILGVDGREGWILYKSDGSQEGNFLEKVAKWYFEICEGETVYKIEDDYCYEFYNGYREGLGLLYF